MGKENPNRELTELEKVELRKFAYGLSFRFPMEKCHEETYKTYESLEGCKS